MSSRSRCTRHFLILGAWVLGGLIALVRRLHLRRTFFAKLGKSGCHLSAYLARRSSSVCWLSATWLDAWLFVIQTGGMAAVAVTFAKYSMELGGGQASDLRASLVAAVALAVLTIINCLGVRAGSITQNVFMILKLLAIAALVIFGLTVSGAPRSGAATIIAAESSPTIWHALIAFGAALIPVQFAYGGWQTACFVAGEVREPRKNLPRGLLLGVLGVIAVYLSVNFVCLYALGPQGLAATKTPASTVMRLALGERGAHFIAAGIAISTVGFLSQSMLTAPRVYFAMSTTRRCTLPCSSSPSPAGTDHASRSRPSASSRTCRLRRRTRS